MPLTIIGAGGGGGDPVQVVTGVSNQTTTQLTTEIRAGAFEFDGSQTFGALDVKFRFVGEYTATGGAGDARIRLYDMGPAAGPPVAGVLRSTLTIPFAEAGSPRRKEVTLTINGAPGTNADEIFNVARLYEVRLFLDSAQSGDEMDCLWAGIVAQ